MRTLLTLLLLLAAPALAQQPAAPTPPGLTPQQAQQALEVLRDPARRAEVMGVLEAVARAAPARPAARPVDTVEAAPAAAPTVPAPAPAAAAPTAVAPAAGPPAPAPDAPLAPDSLGAQVLVGLSERLASLSEQIVEAVRTVTSFPLIVLWLVQFATDSARQGLLLDTLWRLAVVLGTGLAAEWAVARLLRPLYARLAARAPAEPLPAGPEEASEQGASRLQAEVRQSARLWRRARRMGQWLRRLPFGLAALLLDLVPLLAVLAAGYGLVGGVLGMEATPRLTILAALNAYVVFRLVTAIAAMLVAPQSARLRLLPVGDAMAAYVRRWVRRGAAVAIFGYAAIEAAMLFGLYRLAHGALIKLLFLVLAGFVVAIILQQRAAVAARIRPAEDAAEGSGWRMTGRLRAMAAPVWHVVAIVYVAALWVVLALDVRDGFVHIVRLSLVTALVLGGARVVLILALGGLHRLLHGAEEEGAAPGAVHGRLTAYEPVLRAVLRAALGAAAVLALMQVWGMPMLAWLLQTELGGRVLRTMGSIAFTLALAIGLWEAVNLAIDRHLAQLAANAQAARSARLRTLLPMFRTALMVAIWVVVALIVLSEIGLNIAPLLAGAGVFGVALAFGSQRLVQDVITGLFLLLENTMQVGDVVTLGGMSGTVENLSIRTIRLRALDGSMHIIPFSSVTTVTNMTRDFGYAVVDVSIGLNEDPERIGDVLRDIAREMRTEEKWMPGISADLEVMGIDRFIDKALVLRTRIRTTPGQRWAVGRELNRRIKQRFDELAIQSPMSAARPGTPQIVEEASG